MKAASQKQTKANKPHMKTLEQEDNASDLDEFTSEEDQNREEDSTNVELKQNANGKQEGIDSEF